MTSNSRGRTGPPYAECYITGKIRSLRI